jgi:hypothetical protein
VIGGGSALAADTTVGVTAHVTLDNPSQAHVAVQAATPAAVTAQAATLPAVTVNAATSSAVIAQTATLPAVTARAATSPAFAAQGSIDVGPASLRPASPDSFENSDEAENAGEGGTSQDAPPAVIAVGDIGTSAKAAAGTDEGAQPGSGGATTASGAFTTGGAGRAITGAGPFRPAGRSGPSGSTAGRGFIGRATACPSAMRVSLPAGGGLVVPVGLLLLLLAGASAVARRARQRI